MLRSPGLRESLFLSRNLWQEYTNVSGIVAHCEVQGGDARVVAKALVRLQLLPQLVAKSRVCGLHSIVPPSRTLPHTPIYTS